MRLRCRDVPHRGAIAFLLVGVVLASASGAGAQAAGGDGAQVEVRRLAGGNRVETAVAVSEAVFDGAGVALLARADEAADALAAAPLAGVLGAPVLLTWQASLPAATRAELERLGADEVVVLGGEEAVAPAVVDALEADGRQVRRVEGPDRFATAAAAADEVAQRVDGGLGQVYVASGEGFADALAVGALAAVQRAPLLLVEQEAVPPVTRSALDRLDPAAVTVVGGPAVVGAGVEEALRDGPWSLDRLAGSDRYATAVEVHARAVEVAGAGDGLEVWLADGDAVPDALAAGPAAAAGGASLLLVDGSYLEASRPSADHLRALRDRLEGVTLVGGGAVIAEGAARQLEALLFGAELPGGGRYLFPDRRMVAFYGSHVDPRLGVLGEQAPHEVGPRLAAQAQPYADGGDRPVLLAFDLIASLATRDAGPDGDYSAPSTDEEVQAWLDAARDLGAYLVLDLQTGRTDFLTEARRYERFLREPDVGLALDPEWRTPAPDTPGGGTVGYVTAAEVNATSAYLQELVEQDGLPEKLLVVHAFRTDMVRDRADIVRSEEHT